MKQTLMIQSHREKKFNGETTPTLRQERWTLNVAAGEKEVRVGSQGRVEVSEEDLQRFCKMYVGIKSDI